MYPYSLEVPQTLTRFRYLIKVLSECFMLDLLSTVYTGSGLNIPLKLYTLVVYSPILSCLYVFGTLYRPSANNRNQRLRIPFDY